MSSEKQAQKNAMLRKLWGAFFARYDRAVLAGDEAEKARLRVKVEEGLFTIFLNADF